MNSYRDFTAGFANLMRQGKSLPLGGFENLPTPNLPADAPKVLIFSPHPDDECIIGGIALRLMREAGMRVINVAVTQGSNHERKEPRLQELKAACDYIGFELLQIGESGLDRINMQNRADDPADWNRSVDKIAAILEEHAPRAILVPHDDDFNSTHIGVHHLVVDAMKKIPGFKTTVIETEFWGEMKGPNILVELSETDVADMLTALSFHVGEVQRNPYHLRLPGWLMDNVRRGGEVIAGEGSSVPDYLFATLYRLRRWQNNQFEPAFEKGKNISQTDNLTNYL